MLQLCKKGWGPEEHAEEMAIKESVTPIDAHWTRRPFPHTDLHKQTDHNYKPWYRSVFASIRKRIDRVDWWRVAGLLLVIFVACAFWIPLTIWFLR